MKTPVTLLSLLLSATAVAAGEVTCGSAIKLTHKASGYVLHSENTQWRSGSGQRSVTLSPDLVDQDSFWLVENPGHDALCETAVPIKCGSKVRLRHMNSGHNLHSHLIPSPLSRQQEVSAYHGNDSGDDWIVQCKTGNWERDTPVTFQHSDTGAMLSSNPQMVFDQRVCNGCAIQNHLEVVGSRRMDNQAQFMVQLGVHLSH